MPLAAERVVCGGCPLNRRCSLDIRKCPLTDGCEHVALGYRVTKTKLRLGCPSIRYGALIIGSDATDEPDLSQISDDNLVAHQDVITCAVGAGPVARLGRDLRRRACARPASMAASEASAGWLSHERAG